MSTGETYGLWAVLNAAWFGLLVGTALGVAGIWIGIILYKRGKQFSRLRFLLADAPLIGPTPTRYGDRLEVRFDGQPVPRVTSTSYGVWNDGTTTVHGHDIVDADPLRLETSGDGLILRATVEGVTREVNGAAVLRQEHNQVVLGFDYLDPGDGFRIQVLHSGDRGAIIPKGTVRGLPNGIEPLDRGKGFELSLKIVAGFMLTMAVAILATLLAYIGHQFLQTPWPRNLLWVGFLVVIGYLTYLSTRPLEAPSGPPRIKGVPATITEDPTLMGWPSSATLVGDDAEEPAMGSRDSHNN